MNKRRVKKILLTFDYELFLGHRSGSVQRCLIDPTNIILRELRKYDIKHAIFFIDTTYLIRLDDYSIVFKRVYEDYENIRMQIRRIVNEGHYVFPHIHPHWLNALYDSQRNVWSLIDLSKYRFHKLAFSEQEFVFDQSFRILNEIIKPPVPNYDIDSFRAGGWSIQPFIDYKHFFEKYGIKNDFSVIPGRYTKTNAQNYDFSNIDKQTTYTFSEKVVKPVLYGEFTEFPVSVIPIPMHAVQLSHLFQRMHRNSRLLSIGDGVGAKPDIIETGYIRNRKNGSNLFAKREVLSLDFINKYKLNIYKQFIDKEDYVHFLSHPKMISAHGFDMFQNLLKTIKKRYELTTDYKSMKPEGVKEEVVNIAGYLGHRNIVA